jgi:hypothetical protein
MEIVVTFDKERQALRVESCTSNGRESLLEISLRKLPADLRAFEQTLGQFILYSLNQRLPEGLPFGHYESLMTTISEENLAAFSKELNLTSPADKYDLATVMFSQGKAAASWEQVERAITLFKEAAASGHTEARRFVEDDLPVVLPRLEEKLRTHRSG